MPRSALTDRFVAGLHPDTRVTYFDAKTRGLALRVSPTGAKVWSFVYRHKGSPSQWFRLGDYPAVTLAKARKLATTQRKAVDVDAIDPAAEHRAAKAKAAEPAVVAPGAFTFNDLADLYSKLAAGKKKTWRDDVAKMAKYLRPAWGTLPLKSITRAQVHELLDSLVADGMTVGTNRVQALVSRLFTIAVDRSLLDSHPAARMEKRFKERPADRVLTDDEIRALWAGLDKSPGRASDAVRLRLLLGQRGEEIAGMAWSEVDLDAALWQLPAARTKNGRPHAVPLPAAALALLTRQRKAVPTDEARVFPFLTLRSDDHRALSTIHAGAYEWKDLRRTVATRLAGLGFDETTIGRVLNHARVTVTGRHYNQHAYLDEKRRALDAWDQEVTAIVTRTPRRSAKVVAHKPRGRR